MKSVGHLESHQDCFGRLQVVCLWEASDCGGTESGGSRVCLNLPQPSPGDNVNGSRKGGCFNKRVMDIVEPCLVMTVGGVGVDGGGRVFGDGGWRGMGVEL